MARLATATVLAVLTLASVPAQGSAGEELVPFFERSSLAFHHVRYRQVVDGLPVLDAGVAEHVARADPRLTLRQEDLADAARRSGSFAVPVERAVALAVDAAGAALLRRAPEVEAAWFETAAGLRRAYSVTLDAAAPPGAWRVVVDGETAEILHVRDTSLHAPTTVRVFKDNPIVALQDPDFRDNRLSIDDGSFAAAYVDLPFDLVGPGMRGRWIVIEDNVQPPTEGGRLVFPREDPRFLETMALYYGEFTLQRLAALGYEDLVDHDVYVRAHDPPLFRFTRVADQRLPTFPAIWPDAYVTDDRHAYFMTRSPTPDGPGFGSSAEDGETVVHEMGHIIHLNAAPGVEYGDWYSTFAEGASDAYAALVLDEMSEGFGGPCMSEWLTHYYTGALAGGIIELDERDGLKCIRDLEADIHWPEDKEDEGHRDGRFWAGVVWDARNEYGTNATLVLLTEAIYLMPPEIDGFADIAEALYAADVGLTGGARLDLLREGFASRGIETPDLPVLVQPPVELAEAEVPVPAATVAFALVALAAAGLAARRP